MVYPYSQHLTVKIKKEFKVNLSYIETTRASCKTLLQIATKDKNQAKQKTLNLKVTSK